MGYDVSVRTLPAQPTLTMHASVGFGEIGSTLMKMLPHVFEFAKARGGHPDPQVPFVRYSNYRPDGIDLDGGMTLVEPVEGGDGVEAGELPAGEYAMTVHTGSYDTLHLAYEALSGWAGANGRATADWHWERYVSDPMETPVEEVKTEVYQLLA